MTIRNACTRRRRRPLLGLLAAALLATSGGCMTMTTETVPVGSPTQPVSQARAKRDLGIDYLSTRRTAMAIRELTSSLSLDPDDPETHLWLGEAYRRKGRTDEAETFLRDAIRLSESRESSETEQSARLNLSALLAQEGRYEESIEQCRILIADPTVSAPWRPLTNCGWANLQLGRLDEARTQLEEALEFFPRFGPALLNLGILMTKQGHPLKAIAMLERAIESGRLASTGIGEAHYRLGEIYVGLGRRDKAVVHFRAATDEAPHAEWSEQSQAYLDLLN